MARDFVEYVQSQRIDWTPGVPGNGTVAGVEHKLLSVDGESGAATALVRFEAGGGGAICGTLAHDEAYLVLGGTLEVDDVVYRHLAYAHLPVGHTIRRRVAGPRGAVVITFYSAAPDYGRAGDGGGDPARLVTHVDPYESRWEAIRKEGMPPGVRRLGLFDDPATGDQTWLLGAAPIRSGTRAHRHGEVEEMFLVEGTEVSPVGRMEAGAYFWRPPGVFHGPFGTPLPGKLELFRSIGGPLTTEYFDHDVPFDWNPDSNAMLPPDHDHARLAHAQTRIERDDY